MTQFPLRPIRICFRMAKLFFNVKKIGVKIMSELVSSTSDEQFQADVLDAETPVLVDFWAEWCGPCKMLAPILDDVATEFADRVKFVKVNVDDNSETPAKYGVRGIPSLMLFKGGDMVANKVGALTKSQLVAFLEENQ